jgi:predicted transcriptional regulator
MADRTHKSRTHKAANDDGFSRREREIMNALYKLGKASAAQVRDEIAEPPSYTAIRTLLTILEKKGHIRHEMDGPRYVYLPEVGRDEMAQSAIDGLLQTFFGNSVERAVAALLNREDVSVSQDELDRLAKLIEKAKEEGR